jgi:HEAT repeat protein
LLKSETYYIRAGAAEALGRIGPDAKVAVPSLMESLKDEQAQVRLHVMEALKRVEGTAAKLEVER